MLDEPYPDLLMLLLTTVVDPLISITFGLGAVSAGLLVLALVGLLGVLGSAGLAYYFLTSDLGLRTGGGPIPKSIPSRSFYILPLSLLA
jgi:hypothetical protein